MTNADQPARCKHHKKVSPEGYVAWFEWAERKDKQGHKQKQCSICKHYFFKCEMGTLRQLETTK